MLALLAWLCCIASAAPLDPTLAQLETLVREQDNKPADEIRALDDQIAALKKDFAAAGPTAIAPLSKLAADAQQPLKARVWAANFLALLADPAAYEPLSSLALDGAQPAAVREAALSGLESSGVDAAALRRTACTALAQEDLPDGPLDDALALAARTGCEDAAVLVARAHDQGIYPKNEKARRAAFALQALGKSHPLAASRALFDLLGFFGRRSPERGAALTALGEHKENLAAYKAEAVKRLCRFLPIEARAPHNEIAAIRLLAGLDGRACAKGLLKQLGNRDAEVVAEDAEALAALGIAEAKPLLKAIVAGAVGDDRFAPQEGRPDPTELLSRVEAASERLP